jgi:hypothetical protein
MPYEVKDRNGAIEIAEALWTRGQEPLLYYHDALWTAQNALAENLQCITNIPHSNGGTRDIQAEYRWEQAYCLALLDKELTDAAPTFAEAIRDVLADLDPDPRADDEAEENGGEDE